MNQPPPASLNTSRNGAPIRAEIALPPPLSLIADGGRLGTYQRQFTRYMHIRGELFRLVFGKVIADIHAPMGTIDTVGAAETILQILEVSHGKIITLHHHWTENAIREAQASGVTLDHPELQIP